MSDYGYWLGAGHGQSKVLPGAHNEPGTDGLAWLQAGIGEQNNYWNSFQ